MATTGRTGGMAVMAMLLWGAGCGGADLGRAERAIETAPVARYVPPPEIVARPGVSAPVALLVPRLDVASLVPRVRMPEPPPACVTPAGDPTALVRTTASAKDDLGAPEGAVPQYTIYGLQNLFVAAVVRGVCGPQRAVFDLFAPDGSLYKSVAMDFLAAGDGEGARRIEDGYLVGFALPIAGTDIVATPLVGTWSVNVSLDEADRAIGLGLFELRR